MRISKQDRDRAVFELSHWGKVARQRWLCDRKYIHPIARMMELGIATGPTVYTYEYEPDRDFGRVNLIVMELPMENRAILVAHYIDRKSWRKLCSLMGLEKWWHVGKELREAEAKYLLLSEST